MKKVLIFGGSVVCLLPVFLIILVASLLTLDFFGSDDSSNINISLEQKYIVNNYQYAKKYKSTITKYIQNGYVPLERIIYFYSANNDLSFDKVYIDNLENKKLKSIPKVCEINDYKNLKVCETPAEEEESGTPFAKPIDFSGVRISSFFMEQRKVFGKFDVHAAWDLAKSAGSDVYSVCDGIVEKVVFPYSQNTGSSKGGRGNNIILRCSVDNEELKVIYGHLYPNSSRVSAGDTVTKGMKIAEVGTTGYSTGNHLHFEVQTKNGVKIDGMKLINFAE